VLVFAGPSLVLPWLGYVLCYLRISNYLYIGQYSANSMIMEHRHAIYIYIYEKYKKISN